MKDAFIIISAIIVGVGLIYLIVAVLPFLIAVAAIVFMWWIIGMCLSGGFSPGPYKRKRPCTVESTPSNELESIGQTLAEAFVRAFKMLDERLRTLDGRPEQIQSVLAAIQAAVFESRECHEQRTTNQTWFTPTEVADLLGKRPYTVREWCRLRRINARKRLTGRGEAEEWEGSIEEVERYKNHGLLPMPTGS